MQEVPASTFQYDYDRSAMKEAIREVVHGLESASVFEPRRLAEDGFRAIGSGNYVSQDSLAVWASANDFNRDERVMFEEVLKTCCVKMKRGDIEEDFARMEVTPKILNKIEKMLVQLFEACGGTSKGWYEGDRLRTAHPAAQRIASQFDNLISHDFGPSGTDTPREFSRAVDRLMELLFRVGETRKWGRSISLQNLRREIQSEPSLSSKEAQATWMAFQHVSPTQGWGRGKNAYICIDQRIRVHRHLLKLFAGNSPIKRSIVEAFGG